MSTEWPHTQTRLQLHLSMRDISVGVIKKQMHNVERPVNYVWDLYRSKILI